MFLKMQKKHLKKSKNCKNYKMQKRNNYLNKKEIIIQLKEYKRKMYSSKLASLLLTTKVSTP